VNILPAYAIFQNARSFNFTLIMHIHVTVLVIEAMLPYFGRYHDSLPHDVTAMLRTAWKRLLESVLGHSG
jgi:hypothetical protein